MMQFKDFYFAVSKIESGLAYIQIYFDYYSEEHYLGRYHATATVDTEGSLEIHEVHNTSREVLFNDHAKHELNLVIMNTYDTYKAIENIVSQL